MKQNKPRFLSVFMSVVLAAGILTSFGDNVLADALDATKDMLSGALVTDGANPFADSDNQYKDAVDAMTGTGSADADAAIKTQSLPDLSENQYILQFSGNCSLDMIYNLIKDMDYKVIGESADRLFTIRSADNIDSIRTAFSPYCTSVDQDALITLSDNETSSPDPSLSLQYTPTDTYYSREWHITDMNVDDVWDTTKGSADVLVAVIDTGLDKTHPDLQNANIRDGLDAVYSGTCTKDYEGHGTSTTGLITAVMDNGIGIAGIAPNVGIVPISVMDNSGNMYSSYVITAIRAAADASCDVINMSLGSSTYLSEFNSAVQYAYDKGCIVVASSGNTGTNIINYPASYDHVLSVGSIDSNNVISYFSTYNNYVDVVAPGEQVYTTTSYEKDSAYYSYCSGTSFSSPCVAGVAALVKSIYPNMTPDTFESLVRSTSSDLGAQGYDSYYGYGLINAQALLQQQAIEMHVSYQSHVQDIGWQGFVSDGAISGTSGQSKRLEAIQIQLNDGKTGISYRTHVQDYGWMDWVSNGAMSGTSGQSKRLEAIEIQLTGDAASLYDVYYRVHAQNFGWMGWAKNGEPSGTAGYSYRLEAIQIVLVAKGGAAPGSTDQAFVDYATQPRVLYQSHVQDIGWQGFVSNGDISGTSGQSKRLEAMCIKLENIDGGIEYKTHVQDYGWMNWVSNGAMSGTSGESKRLEAIEIRLTGNAANTYDVYYRVHAQNFGWLDWAKNGAAAGTAGFSYRLEAIQIVLVPKGGTAPGATARAFVQA